MTVIVRLRSLLRPVLLPMRAVTRRAGTARRRTTYFRYGIDGVAAELRTTVMDHAAILREFGATVGEEVMFPGALHVVNAGADFSNLRIGSHVHIGADTLFDLADRITIEDYATLSMRTTLITHIDVGPGPLKERRPRQTGPVTIGRGAYLGAGATVLHGVTVGAEATLGAHALVDRDTTQGPSISRKEYAIVAMTIR
jgi:acetyltransferase-like isoleucine patch superfamily enzyme